MQAMGLERRLKAYKVLLPVVSYCRQFQHFVTVNRLGGLNLPSNGVVRLTDHPDMAVAVCNKNNNTQQMFLAIRRTDNEPFLLRLPRGLRNRHSTVEFLSVNEPHTVKTISRNKKNVLNFTFYIIFQYNCI